MPPARILLLRPDTYGDLFLFEPVPRILHHAWPGSEVAVLIRESYQDIVPIIDTEGVRWLTTACDPYRESPGDHPGKLVALRETVQSFAPDCVVAACTEQTWLEAAVAAFLPGVRQIGVGPCVPDPGIRAALEAVVPLDWESIYPEQIVLEPELPEWEKNLRLASALLGEEAPRWWPTAHVPEASRGEARRIVAEAGLSVGEFCVCAAAGTANVQIKSWPAEHYGEILAWLERDHGVRALLIGHVSERERLETVQRTAREHGGNPALWTGRDGEMLVVAALLEAGQFYFGNDTGALHLAAALGRPVVSIFGGGHWPRFQPVAARALTVVQPLPCFGCAWDCYYADAPCVRTISPASVRRALERFLGGESAGQVVFEARDLDAQARALIDTATPRLRFLRADSQDRLRQVHALTRQVEGLHDRLRVSEADRKARLHQVEELASLLAASEADRKARLGEIEHLATKLGFSEEDRAARLGSIARLTEQLRISEADRQARFEQIEWLTGQLQFSETDRQARFEQIEKLTTWLSASEAERATLSKRFQELTTPITDQPALVPRTDTPHDSVVPAHVVQTGPGNPAELDCTLDA